MKFKDLIRQWEEQAADPLTVSEYQIRLPIGDAARVAALAEIYPRRPVDDILRELISAALDEVEAAFPYEPGTRISTEDDQGDPIYEDAGPAPRYRALCDQFADRLRSGNAG